MKVLLLEIYNVKCSGIVTRWNAIVVSCESKVVVVWSESTKLKLGVATTVANTTLIVGLNDWQASLPSGTSAKLLSLP